MSQSTRNVYAASVFLLILSTLAARAADDSKPCKLKRIASLDLTYENHRPTVPVTINGQTETFLVDTGGIYSMVTPATAKKLDLRLQALKPGAFRMFNGEAIFYAVAAKSFGIGSQDLQGYNFMVLPDSHGKEEWGGTIAPDLLGRLDAEFDFAGGKLKLYSQDHCPDSVVYWANDYAPIPFSFDKVGDGINEQKHIFIKAKLDDVDVRVLLDTGSPASAMTLEQARYIFHWSGLPPELKRLNADHPDQHPIYSYPFKTLALDGITIGKPRVLIHDVPRSPFEKADHDIVLGVETLSQLHIYISYGEKILYATAANAGLNAPPASKP